MRRPAGLGSDYAVPFVRVRVFGHLEACSRACRTCDAVRGVAARRGGGAARARRTYPCVVQEAQG